MIKIVVGSKNPVKISAAKTAICSVFSLENVACEGISAPSGVAEQPMTRQETREGAINRVKHCQKTAQADFYVAIEGGVDLFEYGPATFAYIVIADNKRMSIGRSCNLPLPPKIYQALQNGEELGHVMDKLFNTENVKQKQGAIGLLTNGQATRESVYTQAAVLAMAPFVNPALYDE
jgi:inosine/xanthosine triphosphatase